MTSMKRRGGPWLIAWFAACLVLPLLFVSQLAAAQDFLGLLMRGIQESTKLPPRGMGPRQETGSADLAPAERRLSPQDRSYVQEDLARLGFYEGPRDGDLGLRTRTAIRRFQASLNEPQTGYFSSRQLGQLRRSAETAQISGAFRGTNLDSTLPARAGAPTPTLTLTGASNPPKTGVEEDVLIDRARGGGPRNEFSRAVLKRYIKANPSITEDPEGLKRLLATLAYSENSVWPTSENLQRQRRVANGTEFEQEAALEEFKLFLASEATGAPLKILRIRTSILGRYDRKRGAFPLNFGSGGSGYTDPMVLDWTGGPPVKVGVDDWDDITQLPMAEPEAVRLAAQLGQNRTVYAAIRMTVSNIAASERAGDSSLQASGRIESVAIHLPPTTPGAELGTRIATLPVKRPILAEPEAVRPSEARDAIESWTRLGARAEGGMLVARLGRQGGDVPEDSRALQRALLHLALARSPGIANNLPNVFNISARLLTPAQHAQLFARQIDFHFIDALNKDVFRRRDTIEIFKTKYLPAVIAQRPQLPVRLRIISPVLPRTYDLARGSFPIDGYTFNRSDGQLTWPMLGELFDVRTDLASYPDAIGVEERQARAINDRIRNGQPGKGARFYQAVDLELLSLAPAHPEVEKDFGYIFGDQLNIQSRGLDARVHRLAFYEDEALTRLLWDVPLDGRRVQAPQVAVDPLPDLPLGKLRRLTLWGALGLAARSGAEPDFLERSAKTSPAYVNASEFDREAVLDSLRQSATADTPKPDEPAYLMGSVKLGQHDGRTAFVVDSFSLAYARDGTKPQPRDGLLGLGVANPEALARFPIDPATAQILIKSEPSRSFQALFRIGSPKATPVASTTGPKADLSLQIEEIVLLHPRQADRAVARAAAGAIVAAQGVVPALADHEAIRLAITPDRVPLNDETMVLYVLAQSGREPDEQALRWLLVRRWNAEHDPYGTGGEHGTGDNGLRNVWGTFFPKGLRALSEQDVARFTPAFRRWNTLRIAALPRKVTFFWHSHDGSSSFGRPARNHAEILDKIGVSRRNLEESYYGTLDFRTDPSGQRIFKGGIIEMSHQPGSNAIPMAYFRLPNLPASGVGDQYQMYVDLDITRLVASDAKTGLPQIAFDTSATEVRWWGSRTAVTPRLLLATLKTEPTAPLPEIRDTEPDIVGLKIGMAMAEAEAALAGQMKIAHVLEHVGAAEGNSPLATVTRLYVRNDGLELISALYAPEALGGKLLGARRDLYLDKSAVTLSAIQTKLEEKYGAPLRPDVMSWGKTADLPNCGTVVSAINHPWLDARLIRGEAIGPKFVAPDELTRDAEAAARLRTTRRIWTVQWTFVAPEGQHERCGSTVKADFQPSTRLGFAGERVPDDEAARLTTWLVNHKAHADAIKAGRELMQQDRSTGAAAKALPDVKL
ncbi:peptidoglycan-binding domain-containing protein [Methylorubrum populi]